MGTQSQEAAVAALSEENRGAVALAAFKLGIKESDSHEATKMIAQVRGHTSRMFVHDRSSEKQATADEYLSTVETKSRLSPSSDASKDGGDNVTIDTPSIPREEFKNAVSSLLFLHRTVRVSPIQSDSDKRSLADRNTTALPTFTATTRNAVLPFRQVCAASVASESNATNAFYFI